MKIQAVRDTREPAKTDNNRSSGAGFGAYLDAAKTGQSSPADELQAYVNMTPAQRIRASVLHSLGLTESDLAKMSPDERKKIEDKIAAIIKEKMEQDAQKKSQQLG